MCLLLIACYGPKQAARQIDRAHAEQEHVLASRCGSYYPIVIDTVAGETITIHHFDTIPGKIQYVNCDSIIALSKTDPTVITKFIQVKCPDQIIQHDTTIKQIFITKENTAALRASNIERDKYKASANSARNWAVIGWALFIIVTIGLFIILTHKKKDDNNS